ncbi:methionine--tRNA ligase [Candidatus Saccharibacteria bacterium]|nr:methionine--tRNA ligase [Candidatus Saccharibacteria bacterium]MBR6123114.1 methionine--tRNA ligase [Candidatus Saccharibacteria bacterium]
MSKNLYVTTAIPYVNGAPHIGHALDYLLADVYARYQKEQGNTVRFQAGTDEHGNKIFDKALAAGIPVEQYVTENSDKFREFITSLGVTPTDFIRTTSADHARRVQMIWEKLAPHIYSADYEGWYCSGCESFITDKEYEENQGICPDHQKPYERLSEKNYYLRIADFKDQIKEAIEKDQLQILPEFRKREVLKLLADSPDVSISRPKKNLSWGIPVPGDDSQVMYVWLDALSNYLTVLGYPEQDISDYWPADVQIVGKDILRFHAIIWPTILLALGLPLPKVILSHGYILANGQKMSKSIGNVVDPLEILGKYGLDPFRYFFLRHIDTFNDSDFTWDKFDAAYSGELANDLGNLVQRLAVLDSKNDVTINYEKVAEDFSEYYQLMDSFEFSKAFDYAWSKIKDLNKDINDAEPWKVAKADSEKAKEILEKLTVRLLNYTELLKPFLTDTSKKIFDIFQNPITIPNPLFPKA